MVILFMGTDDGSICPSASFNAGVTLFGALPVALIVRDHSIVAAFSTASVGFIMLFALVIFLFACLPSHVAAGGC
jgi:sodium-coupled neutral amino acid transporter 10